MKTNQILQVVSASFILSLGFSQKLPVKAIIISSTQDNGSFTMENNSTQSSDLSQFLTTQTSQFSQNSKFLTTQTSQFSQNSNAECNPLQEESKSIPEPTLISGLVFFTGLGVWSQRKKIISN